MSIATVLLVIAAAYFYSKHSGFRVGVAWTWMAVTGLVGLCLAGLGIYLGLTQDPTLEQAGIYILSCMAYGAITGIISAILLGVAETFHPDRVRS